MSKKLDIKTVIKQFKSVHGDTYDYDKFEYINTDYKSIIVCKTHGEFIMSHYKHYKRKQNCPKCSNIIRNDNNKLSQEDIINRFKDVHKDKYNYDKVKYVNSTTKIVIVCPEHGEFLQNPRNHLNGNGCKLCVKERNIKNVDVLIKELDVFYEYPNIAQEFQTLNSFITVYCKKHEIFSKKQISKLLNKKQYCNICSKEKAVYSGYKLSQWLKYCENYNIKTAFLYLLKCISKTECFYKIGITTKPNIHERYLSKFLMPYKYEIIDIKEDTPLNIFNYEKELLKLNKTKDNRYTPMVDFRGKYETFKNILIWN
jgi:hypothetical protein